MSFHGLNVVDVSNVNAMFHTWITRSQDPRHANAKALSQEFIVHSRMRQNILSPMGQASKYWDPKWRRKGGDAKPETEKEAKETEELKGWKGDKCIHYQNQTPGRESSVTVCYVSSSRDLWDTWLESHLLLWRRWCPLICCLQGKPTGGSPNARWFSSRTRERQITLRKPALVLKTKVDSDFNVGWIRGICFTPGLAWISLLGHPEYGDSQGEQSICQHVLVCWNWNYLNGRCQVRIIPLIHENKWSVIT